MAGSKVISRPIACHRVTFGVSCLKDNKNTVRWPHIMEAIGYRNLDRSNYFNL